MKKEILNEPQNPQFNIDAVISSALPCPFCGEKPKVDKSYMPSEVEITCNNSKCHVRPSVYESVQCVENKGNTVTYTPMFDWHWQSVLDKWNTRHNATATELQLKAKFFPHLMHLKPKNKLLSGLKDKNGKEISEGDKAKMLMLDGEYWLAEVRFYKGCFCLFQIGLDYEAKKEMPSYLHEYNDEIEII